MAIKIQQRGDDPTEDLSLEEMNEAESEAVMEATTQMADLEVDQENQAEATEKQKAKQKQREQEMKFAEVNKLMNKYDAAEKRIKYLNSPEYISQMEKEEREKANAEANPSRGSPVEDKQEKAKLAQQAKERDVRIKETKEAKENAFIEQTVEKFAMKKESEGEHSVLTKDKAYLAAGKVLEHNKKIRGRENSKYLEDNFSKVWDDHDVEKKNFMQLDEATSFMKELLEDA